MRDPITAHVSSGTSHSGEGSDVPEFPEITGQGFRNAQPFKQRIIDMNVEGFSSRALRSLERDVMVVARWIRGPVRLAERVAHWTVTRWRTA